MKISVTFTEEEKKKILEHLYINPCKEIQCGDMNCCGCPFEEEVNAYTKARNALLEKVRATKVEGE